VRYGWNVLFQVCLQPALIGIAVYDFPGTNTTVKTSGFLLASTGLPFASALTLRHGRGETYASLPLHQMLISRRLTSCRLSWQSAYWLLLQRLRYSLAAALLRKTAIYCAARAMLVC
jgi:hypothetical protein